ncbi:MAG: N-acetyltransferase [Kiritimatiellae bacterium]|nr:N-acetyltransferase [Kiritimatiellia bacterium]
MSGNLQIIEAGDTRARAAFLDFAFQRYRHDPNWVPPLRRSQAGLFAGRAAFFAHAEMALLLASRNGKPVGRIAAIHNRAHNERYADRTGFFGFFECEDADAEAACALIARAEAWLRERGMSTLRGPVNPSMNAECGLLVDGFDSPPMALMPYNPKAYVELLTQAGFRKCKDLYAYLVRAERVGPGTEAHARLLRIRRVLERRHPEVKVRPLAMRDYRAEIARIMDVFEQARQDNWGYVPITPEELQETAAEMKGVVDPEIILIAEVDGEPAGASLAIPNVNRGLTACGGRLFPFGFIRFLRAIKRTNEIRIFGVAALPRFRHLGITGILFLETVLRGIAKGYTRGEASWVLEDNVLSNRTIQHGLDPEHYKTYRLYEKTIGD